MIIIMIIIIIITVIIIIIAVIIIITTIVIIRMTLAKRCSSLFSTNDYKPKKFVTNFLSSLMLTPAERSPFPN